ncbi:MAG: glycoside hydrolase family 3 C-terminal domain-containing protein [bacterium]
MRKKEYMMVVLLLGLLVAGSLSGPAGAEGGNEAAFPFRDYNLPVGERVSDLVSRLTLEEKVRLLVHSAEGVPRLGIDTYYYGNEALHGVVRPGNFTVFPQAIALASTWDPELITKITTAISDEARGKHNQLGGKTPPSSGLLVFWSPNVNMARDPRWGRTPETYGEDPYLTSRIGVAFVKGLQGNDPKYIKVVSTPKHFVANNEEHNRLRCNPQISERTLREYYFPGFKACVTEGHAQSVMGAYNALNGIPCNANKWLLTDVLRGDWGFDGYVVTDCGALSSMVSEHKYAKTSEESAAFAVNAGVDLECGGGQVLKNSLISAIKKGLTTEETVNRALTNVLRLRFKLGMFDPPEMVPYNKIPGSVVGSEAHRELALRASRESIVLLKNAETNGEPFLPLDKNKIKSIAVVGPNAAVARFGDYSGWPTYPPVTPLDGLRNKVGDKTEVNYAKWIAAPEEENFVMTPGENLRPGTGSDERGLKAEYFTNSKLEGEPETVRIDRSVDIDTLNKPPDPAIPERGPFSVRWSGKLAPSMTGIHNLSMAVEGSARLYLDGKLILEKKSKEKFVFKSGEAIGNYELSQNTDKRESALAMLEAGKEYDIRIEYIHAKGKAVARLEWIAPTVDVVEARAGEMKMIKNSDVVIAVMGISTDLEREGMDRPDLDLPYDQTEYVKQVMSANRNTVVVLISGTSLSINWIDENVPAIVQAWYPGEQGGNAIADVLFGDYNPGGRLPLTFYKGVEDLPPFDDYEVPKGRTYMYFEGKPIYPFGHGLSYTEFEYGDLVIDRKEVGAEDSVTVSFNVTNAGGRDGDEVAQLYVRDVESIVKQPLKKLRGFERVHLKKGETKKISIPLEMSDLGFWDEKTKQFIVEPGEFEIQVGASSSDIRLMDSITVSN